MASGGAGLGGIPISGAQWLKAFATTARSPWWVPAAATSGRRRRNYVDAVPTLCDTTRPDQPHRGMRLFPVTWTPSSTCQRRLGCR